MVCYAWLCLSYNVKQGPDIFKFLLEGLIHTTWVVPRSQLSYHPQRDGQIEVLNKCVEGYSDAMQEANQEYGHSGLPW